MIIAQRIENLLGGITQQPQSVRFRNQVDAMVNGYPSIRDGLRLRANTEHIAEIYNPLLPGGAGPFSSLKYHLINRDTTEQYLVVLGAQSVVVIDMSTGNDLTVLSPNGLTYLDEPAITVPDLFEMVTVADVSYILNRNKTVALDAATSPVRNEECLFWIKQGAGNEGWYYRIQAFQDDGGGLQRFDALYQSTALSVNVSAWRSDAIAQHMLDNNGLGTNASFGLKDTLTLGGGASGNDTWPNGGFSASSFGSVIHVSNDGTTTPFSFKVEDSRSGTALKYIKDSEGVEDFTDLPTEGPDGFVTLVRGNPEDDRDDYWVVAVGKSQGAAGTDEVESIRWNETIKPAIEYQLDYATMPHLLIRSADTDANGPIFVFQEADGATPAGPAGAGDDYSDFIWSDRLVGDLLTNSNPSFVGQKINNIFFWKNRLGLLSGENVIMSQAAEFFNFWRTTVTDVLDSDPIDVASTHTSVTILKNAVPYKDRLILFSDFAQFSLQGDPLVTPSTVSIVQTTEYSHLVRAKPVAGADAVFFAYNNGSAHGGLREYRAVDAASDTFRGEDLSAHCPNLIEGDIIQLDVDTVEQLLAVVTAEGKLYIYKWYDTAQGRQMSAWGEHTFGDDAKVRAAYFLDNKLALAIERPVPAAGAELFYETCELRSGLPVDLNDASFRTLIDRRIDETGITGAFTYNVGTDLTTIQMPYRKSEGRDFIVMSRNDGAGSVEGFRHPVVTQPATGGTNITVQGDVTGEKLWLGEEYNFFVRLSEQFMRDREGQPRTEGRFQLQNMRLGFGKLGVVTARVTTVDGQIFEYTVQDRALGVTAQLGTQVVANGEALIPIRQRSSECTIEFESDGPFPAALLWLDFIGEYDSHTRLA